MKKTLALILVLCTLLCLFPVAISAEETAPEAGAAEPSYLDLYVKDGLVALFTAYDGVASEEEATAWAPIDFYNKEGYTSYADPTTYTASLARGAKLGWKWEDGYLSHYAHTPNATRGDDNASYLDLNALGALLITEDASKLSLQEVYALTGALSASDISTALPVVEGGAITNLDTLSFMMLGGGTKVGDASTNLQYYAKVSAHGWPLAGQYIEAWTNNLYFFGDYYSGSSSTVGGYYVGNLESGVFEKTLSRNGGESYTLGYRIAPTKEASWGGGASINKNFTNTNATTLQSLIGMNAKVFSVRVYNDVLTAEEKSQNHLADLLGFFGIDAAPILALSAEDLASLMAITDSIDLSYDEADYDALLSAIDDIVNRELIEQQKAARLALYVNDGLVALFSAYDGIAGAEKVWTAENLYGKEGYEDYVDPTSYTTVLDGGWTMQWKWEDGYLYHYAHPGVTSRHDGISGYDASYFDLSALAPSFIKGADSKYTVQQVWQVVGTEAKDDYDYPVIVDGVVTNYDKLAGNAYAVYSGGSVIGDFKNTFVFLPKYDNPKPTLANLFMQYSGSSYNYYFLTEYYTAQTEATALQSPSGADVSAWVMPKEFGVFESTTIANGDGTYTLSYQNRASHWQGNGFGADEGYVFEGSASYTGSTTVNLFKTLASRVYSVRIYNRDLSAAEIAQNHFADLVNFYEINVPAELYELLTTEEITAMYEASASANIARTLDDEAMEAGEAAVWAVMYDAMSVITEEAESIVSFGGVAYRTSGDYGVRALFSVDTDALASLESRGFTIVYGAIVGVGVNGETTVNASAEDLTVTIDEETGKAALETGKGAIVASDAEGGMKHLTEDNVSFALSTTYAADGTQSDYYATTLIYRAFTIITDGEEVAAIYDDVTLGETEGAISLISVHELALADTTGMTPELIERLEAILPTEE